MEPVKPRRTSGERKVHETPKGAIVNAPGQEGQERSEDEPLSDEPVTATPSWRTSAMMRRAPEDYADASEVPEE